MPFDPSLANNELPPLPPPVESIETSSILKKCIGARVALAELKQAAELIPNASVLVNALPLLEAQASSEIENIVTTTDKLLEYVNSPEARAADPATKEALRLPSRLCSKACARCRRASDCRHGDRSLRTIKDEKARAALEARAPRCATPRLAPFIYTPPVGQDVIRDARELAGVPDGEERARPSDSLRRAALPVRAIHPFPDGNGRTGRILQYSVSRPARPARYADSLPERYNHSHKADYYRLLARGHDEAELGTMDRFMLDSIENTCGWTTEKIKAIRDLMRHHGRLHPPPLAKIYTWELVELLFKQPYCRIANVVDAGLAKRQTASVYLKSLAEIGVLRELKCRPRVAVRASEVRLSF